MLRKGIKVIFLLSLLLLSGCVQNEPSGSRITTPVLGDGSTMASEDILAARGIQTSSIAGFQEGIVVSGTGRVKVTPDIALFTVGVTTLADSSVGALDENARVMAMVLEAVRRGGVDDEDIQTQLVSVWPQFDYGREPSSEPPAILGYRAENRIVVRVRDMDELGDLIDSSIEAGANQLYGVSFTVSDESSKKLRKDVLSLAVEDSREKAMIISEAIGAKGVKALGVVEGGSYSPPIYRLDTAALEAKGSSTPISPGEQEVTASLTVTYEIIR